mgnify:CR=1 FL=1|jgi:deoxyadenosine/deoxycytidine kinase
MTLISIEGNIGSGKSTILKLLKQKSDKSIIFIDEPVSEWQTIKDSSGKNILELFYANKQRYSFTFQILAYITRLRKILDVIKKEQHKIIIMERSIYTDKFVFAKMLYENGFIEEIEWKTYNYWFDTFKDSTQLNGIVYVNTKPEICFERIKKRNRNGESNIEMNYLKECHQKHLDWINNESISVLRIDGNQEFENNSNIENEILSTSNKFFYLL